MPRIRQKRKTNNSVSIVQANSRIENMQGHQEPDSIDRISQLPDNIILFILSLLRSTRDVARTSVLSKRWREIWYSFSNLIFDERKFAAALGNEDVDYKKDMFIKYVYNSLRLHLEKNKGIQKLVLHITSCDSKIAPHIDYWLNVAFKGNIKELDLTVDMKKGSQYYKLPQSIYSSRSLTSLRFFGCKLETCDKMMFPCLKKLYLRKMHLGEGIYKNLISSCKSIEDLRLIRCSGLKGLQVSNVVQLKRVEIYRCNQLEKVEVHCANLHTFWFCGKKSTPCKVNLASCKSLKRLTLEHPQVADDFCENQLSKFPLLEKLDLSISNSLASITISNPKVQRLVLRGCKKLEAVSVNTPNLLSFEYNGQKMPCVEIHPFSLREAKLSFEPKRKAVPTSEDQVGFPKLRDFIKKFDSEGLKLVVRSKKNIIIHENLDEVLLPHFPGLNIDIIKSSECSEDILDDLLHTWRPETLSIISPLDSKFPELVYEKMKNQKEDPSCCKYTALNNKCWRHFLKDTEFEDLDIGKKRTSAWLDWLKSISTTLPSHLTHTNLILFWKTPQHGTARKKKSLIVGPWGGNGGYSWDDGCYTGVRQITLVYGHCIDSFQVVYDKHGKPFTAEKHGGVGGNKTAEIKLEYPDEFLISVSGHCFPVVRGGTPVIRSLTFKTNHRTFGPYGIKEGSPFTFSIEGGKVVGFKGRSGWYLDSIAFVLSSEQPTSLRRRVQNCLNRLSNTAWRSVC